MMLIGLKVARVAKLKAASPSSTRPQRQESPLVQSLDLSSAISLYSPAGARAGIQALEGFTASEKEQSDNNLHISS